MGIDDRYEADRHESAIQNKKRAQEEGAAAALDVEDQIRCRLDEISVEVEDLEDRIQGRLGSRSPMGVDRAEAEATARAAADRIRDLVQDDESEATDDELANAGRSVPE